MLLCLDFVARTKNRTKLSALIYSMFFVYAAAYVTNCGNYVFMEVIRLEMTEMNGYTLSYVTANVTQLVYIF